MRKTQPESLESIFESFRRIHLAFVKTQFAFFSFFWKTIKHFIKF